MSGDQNKPKHCIQLTEPIYNYVLGVSSREPDVLKNLREETLAHPTASQVAQMQIPADQGQFMSLLVKLIGAKKTLDIGVFTGYSSTVVALALPEDGKVFALDVSEDFTALARKYWKLANVEHKVQLTLAPAVETLDKFIAEGQQDTFDFAFIDADKPNYINYYERALVLLRKGGLICIDNVLWGGKVADNTVNDEHTVIIRKLNEMIYKDERVDVSLVGIGDGVFLIRKK